MTAFAITLSKVARLASFAVLLAALGGGLPQAAETPDMIYVNARIITLDGTDSMAEAVAIKGEKIQAVGRSDDLRAMAAPSTRIIDVGGKTMIPGIIDPHSHFPLSANTVLFQVDFVEPASGQDEFDQ